jgi:hypothetical protein
MTRGEPLIRQWNLLKALQARRLGIGTAVLTQVIPAMVGIVIAAGAATNWRDVCFRPA